MKSNATTEEVLSFLKRVATWNSLATWIPTELREEALELHAKVVASMPDSTLELQHWDLTPKEWEIFSEHGISMEDASLIVAHLLHTKKIDAIKKIRSITGWPLRQSKDFSERIIQECNYYNYPGHNPDIPHRRAS